MTLKTTFGQSFLNVHIDHLCAIVLHSVMHEIFILTVVTLSSSVMLCATVKIESIIDDTSV